MPRRSWITSAPRSGPRSPRSVIARGDVQLAGRPPRERPTARSGTRRSGGDGHRLRPRRRTRSRIAIPSLDRADRRAFAVGNSFFNDNWVTAPASTEGRDGLGPLFNAQSCSTCHFRRRPGQAARESPTIPSAACCSASACPGTGAARRRRARSHLRRPAPGPRRSRACPPKATVRDHDPGDPGHVRATARRTRCSRRRYEIVEPAYGPLGRRSCSSRRASRRPCSASACSRRYPADDDRAPRRSRRRRTTTGSPARPNTRVGRARARRWRSGASAGRPTCRRSSSRTRARSTATSASRARCSRTSRAPRRETACRAAPDGGDPEVDDQKLGRVTFYTRTLAVPARRDVDERRGRARASSCSARRDARRATCRRCRPATATSPRSRTRRSIPYTDLLLHDMGPGLADGRPDGLASGSEWRTAPLWGIGLVETVNDHTRFLHDGRARNLDGGDPLARRRGGGGQGAVPQDAARRPEGVARLPQVTVRRRAARSGRSACWSSVSRSARLRAATATTRRPRAPTCSPICRAT